MLRVSLTIILGIIFNSNCLAQCSPPGLGKANTASWFAIGLKQNINKKETITSATHFGLGRISNPDNYNLFKKQSIYVINEEIANRFKQNWKLSVALSYRWQNKYKATPPMGRYRHTSPHHFSCTVPQGSEVMPMASLIVNN